MHNNCFENAEFKSKLEFALETLTNHKIGFELELPSTVRGKFWLRNIQPMKEEYVQMEYEKNVI